MIVNSVALVPPSAPCAIPVKGTVPVLVRVKTWIGPSVMPLVTVPKLRDAGLRLAVTTGTIPVPDSETGDPATPTLAVMFTAPVVAPVPVGSNTMLIVQVAPAARVVPHVPPD